MSAARWPGPTLRDVELRLRSLECARSRCPCHKTASQGRGLTHCPLHVDNHPSLSFFVRIGSVHWNCHTCHGRDLTRVLFGDVQIAWAKAEWESEEPDDTDYTDFTRMTAAQILDIIEHLTIAAEDTERPLAEVQRLRSKIAGARKALRAHQPDWKRYA